MVRRILLCGVAGCLLLGIGGCLRTSDEIRAAFARDEGCRLIPAEDVKYNHPASPPEGFAWDQSTRPALLPADRGRWHMWHARWSRDTGSYSLVRLTLVSFGGQPAGDELPDCVRVAACPDDVPPYEKATAGWLICYDEAAGAVVGHGHTPSQPFAVLARPGRLSDPGVGVALRSERDVAAQSLSLLTDGAGDVDGLAYVPGQDGLYMSRLDAEPLRVELDGNRINYLLDAVVSRRGDRYCVAGRYLGSLQILWGVPPEPGSALEEVAPAQVHGGDVADVLARCRRPVLHDTGTRWLLMCPLCLDDVEQGEVAVLASDDCRSWTRVDAGQPELSGIYCPPGDQQHSWLTLAPDPRAGGVVAAWVQADGIAVSRFDSDGHWVSRYLHPLVYPEGSPDAWGAVIAGDGERYLVTWAAQGAFYQPEFLELRCAP